MNRSQRARGGRAAWVGVAVSLGIHGGIVVALFGLPDRREAPAPPPRPITVERVEWVDLAPVGPPPGATDPGTAEAEPLPPNPEPTETTPLRPSRRARAGRANLSDKDGSEAQGTFESPPGPSSAGLDLRGLRRPSAPRDTVPPPVTRARPPKQNPTPQGATDLRTPTLAEVGFEPGPGGTAVRDDPALPFIATIASDGRLSFRHRTSTRLRYYQLKTRIQRETRALRLEMARRSAKAQMRRQLTALAGQLGAIWSRRKPAVDRRRALFELWDECAEASDSLEVSVVGVLDRERARAGREARARIVAFIRRELPEGSVEAYGADELATLNASRLSRERFEPYARR